MTNESVHASKRALLLVFVLSFSIFLLFRWDADSWVEKRLYDVVQSKQLPLTWQRLHVSGLQVRLFDVQWQDARLQQAVEFAWVDVSPAWSALLSASAAVQLEAQWQGTPVRVNVAQQDGYTQLSGIDVHLQLENIATYLPVPAELFGEIALQGEALIGQDGMLHDGDIRLQWQQVNIAYMGVKLALGQSELNLQHQQDTQWHWQLDVQGDVNVQGDGKLNMLAAQPQQWLVDGRLAVSANPSTPVLLASMLRSSGSDTMAWSLQGALLQPQMQQLPTK